MVIGIQKTRLMLSRFDSWVWTVCGIPANHDVALTTDDLNRLIPKHPSLPPSLWSILIIDPPSHLLGIYVYCAHVSLLISTNLCIIDSQLHNHLSGMNRPRLFVHSIHLS